ncbi:MAG TPA: gliding motility-associated C-terminal domain-containing protein, partial [Cyclobacteriaceae bacterium]|nr:gliding motility-associated C-terminal domain-containing protein [Cyclobacteriaceae bacterium]
VEFIKNANLYHPDAFTPNGDNLNDGFTVRGQFIVKMNLKIYDRWGALLFATEKNEPWDGRSEGKAMPPATYIWKAEITDLAGRTFSEHGTVALLRN